MSARILLVDDDHAFRLSTAAILRDEAFDVTAVENASDAVTALGGAAYDLILLDLRMPGVDGISLAEVLRKRGESVPILMISGFGSVDSAVKALHSGVDDFVTKPVEPEVLLSRVRDLLERRPSGTSAEPVEGLLGRSSVMEAVRNEIRQVAGSDATVLITGETGTGKELAASAVHRLSPRAGGKFVAVNCAALSEGLLESELFGHIRGAFTGALQDREGLIRAAHKGTLLLDEIGDVSPAVQQRLLRVLQEREVVPLGSHRPQPVDIRLIAATNRDLQQEVDGGRFREDLFFRINVFHIRMPPLRDRPGDVALLIDRALRSMGRRGSADVSSLAMRTLLTSRWPGNVRQLHAALESASIRAGQGVIQAHHLPEEVRDAATATDPRYRQAGSVEDERDKILSALREAGGVRVRAAEILGMGRTTLWRKIQEYRITEGDG
ncbi:MAG: sigma-54 dependent transcriptional regulator [Gemmatimonadota bacterium]|nr:sigma-54 dependent transcriptional regulator [Gemmatimonadota bacterium]